MTSVGTVRSTDLLKYIFLCSLCLCLLHLCLGYCYLIFVAVSCAVSVTGRLAIDSAG